MYEVKISALSEYLKHIENFSLCYPVGRFFNNPTDNPFLFRGLCDSKYELLPSVFRECRDTEFGLSITNAKYLEWNSEKGLFSVPFRIRF